MKGDLLRLTQYSTLLAPASQNGAFVTGDFDLTSVFEALILLTTGALGGATTLAVTMTQKDSLGNYVNLTDANGNTLTAAAFLLAAAKTYVVRIDARALRAGPAVAPGAVYIPTVQLSCTAAVSTVIIGAVGVKGSRREVNRGLGEVPAAYPLLELSPQHALMS